MSRRKDRRPVRTRFVATEPIPVSSLRDDVGDTTVATRTDGHSGRGEQRPPRQRSGSTEPLPMSHLQLLQALACYAPLWDLAATIDATIQPHDGPGRPRTCATIDILLFEQATWEVLSCRAVERTFADPTIWQALRNAVKTAWPDHPQRRLSEFPPTRDQHYRFRLRHLEHDDIINTIRTHNRNTSCRIATSIGLFNGDDSFTHPAKTSLVAGDATWIISMFNTPPGGQPYINSDTGEIIPRRSDPDAVSYHRAETGPGRYLITALARGAGGNERVILDLAFKPHKESDATTFTNITLNLSNQLPNIRGTVYDMAIHAADTDRLLDAGLIPISKVQRTSKNKPASANLGEHHFRTTAATPATTHIIYSLDGAPCIQLVITGEAHFVPLVREQLKRQRNNDGQHRIYGHWSIPHQPGIPQHLRGARTMIRHNSDPTERAHNARRTRSLRPIPENDPDFARLYGLREDTESMHHHLKQRLWNGRARTIGLQRQTINHHAYQTRTALIALIATHYRTRHDLTAWFGHWQPPGATTTLAA